MKDERAKEKNRLQSPGYEKIQYAIKQMIKDMNRSINNIEKRLDALIEQDAAMKQKIKLITKYKGVGKTTAIQLMAQLPELGKINRNSISALAGVAPYARGSGKNRGYRTTKDSGRPVVKRILFMAAMNNSYCYKCY
jgi:transposase